MSPSAVSIIGRFEDILYLLFVISIYLIAVSRNGTQAFHAYEYIKRKRQATALARAFGDDLHLSSPE